MKRLDFTIRIRLRYCGWLDRGHQTKERNESMRVVLRGVNSLVCTFAHRAGIGLNSSSLSHDFPDFANARRLASHQGACSE